MEIKPETIKLALAPGSGFFIDFDRVGEAGFKLLREVVAGQDLQLAEDAVRLAAHLQSPASFSVIATAARSPNPRLRQAAARALGRRTDHPPAILARLLMDPCVDVRGRALAVLSERPAAGRLRYLAMLRRVRRNDPDPALRREAERLRLVRPRRAGAAS